jgi:hypothetical protein
MDANFLPEGAGWGGGMGDLNGRRGDIVKTHLVLLGGAGACLFLLGPPRLSCTTVDLLLSMAPVEFIWLSYDKQICGYGPKNLRIFQSHSYK